MKKAAAQKPTTGDEVQATGVFGVALIDLGWQLAILVLGSLILGVKADARFGTKPLFSLMAIVIIAFGFIVLVKRQVDRLPKSFGGRQ